MGVAADILEFFTLQIGEYANKTSNSFIESYRHYDVKLVLKTIKQLKNKGWLFSGGFTSSTNLPFADEVLVTSTSIQQDYVRYGAYEYIAFGFPYIRQTFEKSVVALEVTKTNEDKDIGSGFLLSSRAILTCRHCIEGMQEVLIHGAEADGKNIKSIIVPNDPRLDLALITFNADPIPGALGFRLVEKYKLLGEVMTMGYPPIPGFTNILISETAQITGQLKSSVGQVVGSEKSYLDQHEYILITARVKGGNSGGPVINEEGMVVAIVTHIPSLEEGKADSLGFGAALPVKAMVDFLGNKPESIISLRFSSTEKGFRILE